MVKRIFLGFLVFIALGSSASSQTVVSGSGFFITSDGYLVTNNHVIEGGGEIRVRDSSGVTHNAEVVRKDASNDLAILKLTGKGFSVLPIRSSSEVRKGASVFTVGFPNIGLQGSEAKITEGVISSLSGIVGEPNSFQISVPVQPGNSGGPLLDTSGAVVGIVTAKLSYAAALKRSGSLPENVNYAVKSNYLMELVATIPNLTRKLRKPSGSDARPLTSLVAGAEQAVVLIVSKERIAEGDSGGSPSPPEGGKPRYERDAEATQNFEKGTYFRNQGKYHDAILWLGKAAEQGNANAQNDIGFMYEKGQGVTKDEAEAVKWYRKAAERGNANAQTNLGSMYADGRGVTKDDTEAVKWYRKAADQGYALAQYNLGIMYENGRGVTKDDAEAVKWYRKASEQGDARAQSNLGGMYANGRGVTKDDAEAVKWYRKAAEQGLTRAQNNLVIMYANGRGVTNDDAEAVRWYRKAAEQGNALAQNNLGVFYEKGQGVAKDYEQAVIWYRRAAEQGHARAQSNLGFMYANGRGVAKDDAEAVKWYRKASEQGDAQGQFNLGVRYANGQGVAKDDAEAVKWYRMAADQGYVLAQNNLGFMYANGRGVAKDEAEAVRWFRKAAEQGYAGARAALKKLGFEK